jgi:hypothetical protein
VLGLRRSLVTTGFATLMVAGALGAGLAMTPPDTTVTACSQSIDPLNPYVQTCGIPNNPPVVPGASPGAGAIIACRDHPGCLSYVVNGGPGANYQRPSSSISHSP